MRDKLIIIGASGHGKVVADIAIKNNKWKYIAFLDDDDSKKSCLGLEVIGKTKDANKYKNEADFFVAIGENFIREKIQKTITNYGLSVISLIHPSAIIGNDVIIGEGTVIMAGAVVNSSSRIGRGCIINTGATLDHDNIIEDYVHISPGVNLAGSVRVGNYSWIGIGSMVVNNTSICSDSKLGAGSLVIKDIIEPGTYIGTPIKKI